MALPSPTDILLAELARVTTVEINTIDGVLEHDDDFEGIIMLVEKDHANAGQTISDDDTATYFMVLPDKYERLPMAWMKAYRKLMAKLIKRKAKRIFIALHEDANAYSAALGICQELLMPGILKTEKKYDGPSSIEIGIYDDRVADFKRGLAAGRMSIIERTLGLVPPNILDPKAFMDLIIEWQTFRDSESGELLDGIKVEDLALKHDFGLLKAVGGGKAHMAMIWIMPMDPNLLQRRPIAVNGKGVTFDSGGLQIKPTNSMRGMERDMLGGAAAFALADYLAQNRELLRRPVVILIPLCQNLVHENAMRPGDVYEAFNGKRVMIGHTDAEGRLGLADGNVLATKMFNSKYIIDVATLTGAALAAMGDKGWTAIMCEDEQIIQQMRTLGWKVCDPCMPLPHELLEHDPTKSDVTDLTNLSTSGEAAQPTSAYLFLKAFCKPTDGGQEPLLVHCDIAASACIGAKVPGNPGVLVIAELILNLD